MNTDTRNDSLLSELSDKLVWQSYLTHKLASGTLSKKEEASLAAFIQEKRYLPIAKKLQNGASLGIPRRIEINKMRTGKKRIVYAFAPEENLVLGLIAWLLHRYDALFAPNLYSFRQRKCAKDAVCRLMYAPEARCAYIYKVDIHDYFISIPLEKLFPMLEEVLAEDPPLLSFFKALLAEPQVLVDGRIEEVPQKGIMAGLPVAAFLANLYLKDLDWHFAKEHKLYARYSDDIIILENEETMLEADVSYIQAKFQEKGLTVNPKKEHYYLPGEPWEFLGFLCNGSVVDISPAAKEKLKGKMRRKSRALLRWGVRKELAPEKAILGFIRHYNRKLYDNPVHGELTWCRWYFPVINTAESLHELDRYMLQCIRYIMTGRHCKKNYALSYEKIKELGYRSLVHEFYKMQ